MSYLDFDPAYVRLEAENERLRAALKPFAIMADQLDKWQRGTNPKFDGEFDADDLRRAREVLADYR